MIGALMRKNVATQGKITIKMISYFASRLLTQDQERPRIELPSFL